MKLCDSLSHSERIFLLPEHGTLPCVTMQLLMFFILSACLWQACSFFVLCAWCFAHSTLWSTALASPWNWALTRHASCYIVVMAVLHVCLNEHLSYFHLKVTKVIWRGWTWTISAHICTQCCQISVINVKAAVQTACLVLPCKRTEISLNHIS